VSTHRFSGPNLTVIEVPEGLDGLTNAELITGYRVNNGHLVSRQVFRPAKHLRVAFVGNWKMRCGIATYSEQLWPAVARRVGDFKLFIERNDKPTGPVHVMGEVLLPHEKVVSCWKRGESLADLERELEAYAPDIVWIQHEFGIWPDASRWLPFMARLSQWTRPVVTMHSVFHHRDKTIVEAAIPEIVVHLEGAAKVLKEEKGVPGKVTVIPHGCQPVDSKERLWNFYKSDHTFMQFGFGFRYKGWELSIRAAAELKKKYEDVFFTGLFSESPFNAVEHQVYYDELMRLVDSLGLRDNVAIIRGYQSDAALDSYIRTNAAVIFPYVSHPAHEVFGVSGAARYAMAKCAPVVTTNVNHFSDVPTLKADTPEALAEALDRMFSNPLARHDQVERQLRYIDENTWDRVAQRYVSLFETG
jgi:glycosyltransferase involved in cell wall biosynthesis